MVSRVRIVDRTSGIQIVKGGQLITDDFFQSLKTAYSNASNSPTLLLLFTLVTLIVVAEHVDGEGPLELAREKLKFLEKSRFSVPFGIEKGVKALSRLLRLTLHKLIAYKRIFSIFSLFYVVYGFKPSSKNLILCSILAVIVWLGDFQYIETLILGHLVFIYSQIRNPFHRVVVLVIGFVALICVSFISVEHSETKPVVIANSTEEIIYTSTESLPTLTVKSSNVTLPPHRSRLMKKET